MTRVLLADQTMWEADLRDGRTVREAEGARYYDLPFSELVAFRLMLGAKVVVEMPTNGTIGRGEDFRFRRDTKPGANREVRFKIGFTTGPVWVVDLDGDQWWQAPRFHSDAFCGALHCEPHPEGAFYPPSDEEVNAA